MSILLGPKTRNKDEGDLFLAKYNQAWEQRRVHVKFIWTIPTAGLALIGVFTTLLDQGRLNIQTNQFLIIFSMLIIAVGFFGLFWRHNFFIKVFGLLLMKMQDKPVFRKDLPQLGSHFKAEFKDQLSWLERFGALFSGTVWWGIVTIGVVGFVIANWTTIFANKLPT